MARILRTSKHDGTSYNGFRWSASGPVEAPDWSPTPKCGHGLHGLLEGRGELIHLCWEDPNALWQVVDVEVEDCIDLKGKVKFPRGNVIYSGDLEGALSLLAGEQQTVREWVLQDPEWACNYALHVDGGPRDDTREAAIKGGPEWAYNYALNVDKGPRDDTRKAAIKGGPERAYIYARDVDKAPRDDTRKAVIKGGGPRMAYLYARFVDKAPRDDTRKAVIKGGPDWADDYARFVGKKD